MTQQEAQALPNGLYRIYWKNERGGHSVAAVGMTEDGRRWLAPTNWLAPDERGDYWRLVKRVRRIGT